MSQEAFNAGKRLIKLYNNLLVVEAEARKAAREARKPPTDEYIYARTFSMIKNAGSHINILRYSLDELGKLKNKVTRLGPEASKYKLDRLVEAIESEKEIINAIADEANNIFYGSKVYELNATFMGEKGLEYISTFCDMKREEVIDNIGYGARLKSVYEFESCTTDNDYEKLAMKMLSLIDKLNSLNSVKLLREVGPNALGYIERVYNETYTQYVENMDEKLADHLSFLKNVYHDLNETLDYVKQLDEIKEESNNFLGKRVKWVPYQSIGKIVSTVEDLLDHLGKLCLLGENIYSMIEPIDHKGKNGFVKALYSSCHIDNIVRNLVRLDGIYDDNGDDSKPKKKIVTLQHKVNVDLGTIDSFKTASRALGKPVGFLIPSAQVLGKLSVSDVLEDVADYMHVMANEIKKRTVDGLNCLVEKNSDKQLVELCGAWSKAIEKNEDEYRSMDIDTEGVIGYIHDNKMYLRVRSPPSHEFIIMTKKGDKINLEYYESDPSVRKMMSELLEEYSDCSCREERKEWLECACPLENSENVSRLATVISRATGMKSRFEKLWFEKGKREDVAVEALLEEEKKAVENTIELLIS
ncbi:MAG: hypothetical protein ACP5IE_00260 [Infirmifilum sp.]